MFKIFHLGECPTSPMEPGRGDQIKLINPALGTEKVDVHLNRLIPGGPRGKHHHHTKADNVYIVKRGEGTLTVEDKTYVIRENDVVVVGMSQNPHPRRAFKVLTQRGVPHKYMQYGSYLSNWRQRLAFKMWTGWPTFPMVFVKGTFVGGADDLTKLAESGELDRLLQKS